LGRGPAFKGLETVAHPMEHFLPLQAVVRSHRRRTRGACRNL
jgi:hypothetical protein